MEKKGIYLILLTAVISGFSVFFNKYLVSLAGSTSLALFKNFSVALFIISIILYFKESYKFKSVKTADWIYLSLSGFLGGGLAFVLFFEGLKTTSASQGSFIHKTMFLYVSILAIFLLKEKISTKFLLVSGLLLLGNFLFIKKIGFDVNQGDFLVFIATLIWAGEGVFTKYFLKRIDYKILAFSRMFFGSIFIFIALRGQSAFISSLGYKDFLLLIIGSLLLLGYVMTWYGGLQHIPVSLASAILLLGSPITTLVSFVSGAELPNKEIFGSVLILIGIILILKIKIFEEEEKSYVRN